LKRTLKSKQLGLLSKSRDEFWERVHCIFFPYNHNIIVGNNFEVEEEERYCQDTVEATMCREYWLWDNLSLSFFFFLVVLEFEFRTSCFLGRHFSTQATLLALATYFFS
jgi:hypothetical protein